MPNEYEYDNQSLLHQDDFADDLSRWHHEGGGTIERLPQGGMKLTCAGSKQGSVGCMAFFRPNLPDGVGIEYELTILKQGGLVLNYLATRGMDGEDLIDDADRLAPRTGIMANYFAKHWGLQSYHVSVSRFDDDGQHTGTCNWRRNPGCLLIGHGHDRITDMRRPYHIRLTKDAGHLSLFVDGKHAHGVVDRDTSSHPIPDTGKFGFRLIGADVTAEVRHFRVFQLEPNPKPWVNHQDVEPA